MIWAGIRLIITDRAEENLNLKSEALEENCTPRSLVPGASRLGLGLGLGLKALEEDGNGKEMGRGRG